MALITSANARQLAAKALIARRANRERARNLDQTLADLAAKVTALAPLPAEQLSGYVEKRLVRVRRQLDRIDEMLMEESDPQKLDRLAAASMRLAEQERILAGRPLPGSRRPPKEPVRRPAYHEMGPIGLASDDESKG